MTNKNLIEYSDMSNEDYHAHSTEYISSSFVKNASKHSIKKALLPFDDASNAKALILGDAFHTLMESESNFDERFSVLDDADIVRQITEARPQIKVPQMTSEYKKWLEEQDQSKQMITLAEHNMLYNMKESVMFNASFTQLKMLGYQQLKEYSYFTKEPDERYGLMFRIRPDLQIVEKDGYRCIIDYKTCQDASHSAFKKDFYKYRYDLQAVFYCWVLGIDASNFYFVAVSKNEPYESAVYGLDDYTIAQAASDLHATLQYIADWRLDLHDGSIKNSNEITYL